MGSEMCIRDRVVGASSKFLTCERRGDKAVLIPETTECDEVVCDPIEMSKYHQHHPYISEKCPGGSVRDRPECELTCNLGYVFGSGSMTQTVRCDDSGSWESIPTCSPVACPKMQGIVGTLCSNTKYKNTNRITRKMRNQPTLKYPR